MEGAPQDALSPPSKDERHEVSAIFKKVFQEIYMEPLLVEGTQIASHCSIHEDSVTFDENFVESNMKNDTENVEVDDQNVRLDPTFLAQKDFSEECEVLQSDQSTLIRNFANLNLVEKSQSYLDQFRRYLDFRFNPDLRTCKSCLGTTKREIKTERKKVRKKTDAVQIRDTAPPVLNVYPAEVEFHNCKSGETYTKVIKIVNAHSELEGVSVIKFPKTGYFALEFDGGKIAPGMSLIAKVYFTPSEGAPTIDDEVIFRSTKGDVAKVTIRSTRDPPKLCGYIYKNVKDSKFFVKINQDSHTLSIDCGSCLVTRCVPLTLILGNIGYDGRFLLVSKKDWLSKNSPVGSNTLKTGSFSIKPAYFEIGARKISEIRILFQPLSRGRHIESLYLLSDNNCFQPLKIVGNAVCFTREMISVYVDPSKQDIAKNESHCIFLGNTSADFASSVTLEICNKSPIFLKFFLEWENKCDLQWIKMEIDGSELVPFGSSKISLHADFEKLTRGYNCAHLRLFICDVPIMSLKENKCFLIYTAQVSLESVMENSSNVYVQCLEIEIACCMDGRQSPSLQREPTVVAHKKLEPPVPTIVLSTPFLEFGMVPAGIDFQKKLHLRNLGTNEVQWSFVELSYHIDRFPYMEIEQYSNLSSDEGCLPGGAKHFLIYSVVNKNPHQHLSILILYSRKDGELKAEDVCLVTYEIVRQDVVIKSSRNSVIRLNHMFYVDVPVIMSIEIENLSPITGCFYFLKHVGKEANKISIEYKPLFGTLGAGRTKRVDLKVTCHDVGILEEVYIRCFVGCGQDVLLTRLVCLVDCIHVYFHLPTETNGYKKIQWPPRVENEGGWNKCWCKGEETPVNIEELLNENGNLLENSQSIDKIDKHLKDLKFECLKEHIVRVYKVPIRRPLKIKFYIENITPKVASYTIRSTNFSKKNVTFEIAHKVLQNWGDCLESMLSEHGILIQVENSSSGSLGAFEFLPVDVLIYANTFGVYIEEIVVDIEDIACFEFSVIVEVIGSPLYLPMFERYTTDYPTLRLGCLSYKSEDVERRIDILNISSIPLRVIWHTFFYNCDNTEASQPFNVVYNWLSNEENIQLELTDRYFGTDCSNFIEVIPSESYFSCCRTRVTIALLCKPSKLEWSNCKKWLTCLILGRILIDEDSSQKPNYYYRQPEPIIIVVTAKVEAAYLDVEMMEDDRQLHVFVNDALLHKKSKYDIKFFIKNDNKCDVAVQLSADEPYHLADGDTRLELVPGGCEMVSMFVGTSRDELLKWAVHLYRPADSNENVENLQVEKCDKENKILTIRSNLNIYYERRFKDEFSLFLHLHYPNIAVKPNRIKFGHVFIGSTVQGLLSIFNLTGSEVPFQIFKTCVGSAIVAIPDSGTIEKSTGFNQSVINIAVYFTPSDNKPYQEAMRIVTNIPEYFMDVAIEGCGSWDEKFAAN